MRHHRDAFACRIAGGDPIADLRAGVERVQQVDRVRTAGQEPDRDVAAIAAEGTIRLS